MDENILDRVKKLHFVGIGGSGMCPMAEILHHKGFQLTGSDINESDTLERIKGYGIPVAMGHKAENIGDVYKRQPLGRAVELWHLLAGDLPVKGLVLLQLLAEALRIGDGGHIRVGIGVVAHGVPLLHHAADKLRLGLQIVAHQKEGGRDVVLF